MLGGGVGDLEDLVRESDDVQSRLEHTMVLPRVRRQARAERGQREETGKGKKEMPTPGAGKGAIEGHFLPGRASVYIKTWGCSHNNSDGEYMAGQLAAEGYTVTDEKESANVWILNSCTVKNPSQDVFINQVREGSKRGVKVVVAGCVPQGERKNPELKNLSMIGVQQIDRVVEVVEQAIQGNVVRLTSTKKSAVTFDGWHPFHYVVLVFSYTACSSGCSTFVAQNSKEQLDRNHTN